MNYKKLKVWKKSHLITLTIYKLTSDFPDSERYGLISQMRRAASSVPMNIAEGAQSISDQMFIKHLGIARGSAAELEYQLILAKDLNFIEVERASKVLEELEEVLKMLNGLYKKIKEGKNTLRF